MRWSPINTVFSIEPLGITRACATPPSIKMNASTTQAHETTSAHTREFFVCFATCGASEALALCFSSAFTMRLHFQLHQLGGIVARVARSAEFLVRVAHRVAHRIQRYVAQRIRA